MLAMGSQALLNISKRLAAQCKSVGAGTAVYSLSTGDPTGRTAQTATSKYSYYLVYRYEYILVVSSIIFLSVVHLLTHT